MNAIPNASSESASACGLAMASAAVTTPAATAIASSAWPATTKAKVSCVVANPWVSRPIAIISRHHATPRSGCPLIVHELARRPSIPNITLPPASTAS